jgi:hypothetical protein
MWIMNTVIPALLQARAAKLGCVIIAGAGREKGLDFGPFLLWWEGYPVWGHGLPAEGIADALDRIERQQRLWLDVKTGEWFEDTGWIVDKAKYDAGMKKIWCDFGLTWLIEEHVRTAGVNTHGGVIPTRAKL